MENTLGNKYKFFALYWGLEFTGSDYYDEYMPDTWSEFPKYVDKQYLILKPLSSISDEDKECLDALQASSFDEYGYWFGMGVVHYYQPHEVDYLRSRGYALPWMGLSVEE